jgi:TfoX/Sxy family transcriptional regulator of competence genes
MPYNEQLADNIREALSHLSDVEEKKMFRGICFMVNGKMCVTASHDEMMVRFDPADFEAVMEKPGCHAMIRNGKALKGFVFVGEESWRSKRDFMYWIDLALTFNKHAKATKKKNPESKTLRSKTAKSKIQSITKSKPKALKKNTRTVKAGKKNK